MSDQPPIPDDVIAAAERYQQLSWDDAALSWVSSDPNEGEVDASEIEALEATLGEWAAGEIAARTVRAERDAERLTFDRVPSAFPSRQYRMSYSLQAVTVWTLSAAYELRHYPDDLNPWALWDVESDEAVSLPEEFTLGRLRHLCESLGVPWPETEEQTQ